MRKNRLLPENILSGKVRDEYRRNADYRALFPFIKVTMERISFTMRDPIIRKIRMLLVQEQFRDERISEVTTFLQSIYEEGS